MLNVSLEQGYSVTTMLAVAATAVLLAGTFYYRARGTLDAWRWRSLLALRTVAILLIVLLLFRPVFSYSRDLKQHKALIFLLDTSSSMSISDDATGVTRFNQARGQIQRWWERLDEDFDLHVIEFSERARPLTQGRQELSALSPDGKATSLLRALSLGAKLPDEKQQPIDAEAVIMLSDGIHNATGDPRQWAQRMFLMKRPVHTVGVGASLRSDVTYRDVQVTGVDCPDRLLLNNIARIAATVEGIGLAGRVVNVVLEDDEKQVEQAELTLDSVEGSQEVVFEFRPTTTGQHRYTVRVEPVSEERIEENNQRSAVATVVEPGIRVLYVEGTIRAEYGALVQRFLAKDPDLEFCSLVQTRPNVFSQRTNIEGLELTAIPTDAETINTFDVFILGDLDSSYLRRAQQELIVQRVQGGAGLLMLGGYHSLGPGGYSGTPLGEILPVLLGGREIGQITEPLLPVLTPDGAVHGIFANISGFFPTPQREPIIGGLPALDGCTRVEAARPGATVLARVSGDSGAMPVLAVQPVQQGRTAVFCGDTTRKWQQGPRAMDQESPFLRFWGQMVRWLAGRSSTVESGAGVTAHTDKAYYEPGEPIRVSAVVRDEEGEGAENVEVHAKIRSPAGRPDQVTLNTVPGPGGHYSSTFDPDTAGNYEIVVAAQLAEQTLASEKIMVEVGRPNMEFEQLDLDEDMLGEIASITGGRYFHITTADYLIEQLDRSLRKRRESFTFPHYRWPMLVPTWLLFTAVLTTEWILRRRFQLR